MPLRCWKLGSRITRLQRLLLPCLLILALWLGDGWTMTHGEIKELRSERKRVLFINYLANQ